MYAANLTCVRYYAKSKGILHKTDKVDAKVLTEFALERQPQPTHCRNEHEDALKRIRCPSRHQLIRERTALKKSTRTRLPTTDRQNNERVNRIHYQADQEN
jgi:transposase